MSELALVTGLEYAKGETVFRRETRFRVQAVPDDESSLSLAVREQAARAVIVGVVPYWGPLYESLGEAGGLRGAIISRFGVGHDSIDLERAREHTVVVTNTPGVLDISVAEHTMWLVNADRLAMMKRGALLINTARGAVVDEDALYDALSLSRLAGAALDVFKREPYQPTSPQKDLRLLDNVVLTPHVGSNTQEANARMAKASLENVSSFFAGRMAELSRVEDRTG